jgi:hypothetical protein
MKGAARIVSVDVHRIASWCVAVAVFFLFSTPSIKLFLYTEAINIVPVLLLLAAAVLRPPRLLSRTGMIVLLLPLTLFAVLFAYGAYNSASLEVFDVAKYVILCFLAIAVPLLADRNVARVAVSLVAAWGVVLAIYQLGHGFELDRDKGQNYLTVGYALGSTSLLGLLAAISARTTAIRLLGLGCFALAMAATATLLGRGPLVFPLLVVVFYLLVNLFLEPSLRKLSLGFAALVALAAIVAINLQEILAAAEVLQRLTRLSTLANEPRVADVYLPAVDIVSQHPLGLGLAAHERVLGSYPHNVFLELTMSGGVLASGLFLVLSCLFFRHVFTLARDRVNVGTKCLFLLTVYFFLIWNVSFDFASAYGLLPVMTMFASRTRDQLREWSEVAGREETGCGPWPCRLERA